MMIINFISITMNFMDKIAKAFQGVAKTQSSSKIRL